MDGGGRTIASLDQRDIDVVVAASGELASLGDVASFRAAVPALVARVIPGTRAAWNDVDLVRGDNDVVLTAPLPLWPSAGAELVSHLDEHPLFAHFRRTGDGQPHAISELVSADQFHRTGLYNEIYRRLGIEDQLGATIPGFDAGHHIQLTVDRDRWGFSERDRLALALLQATVMVRYDALVHLDRLNRLLALREEVADPDVDGVLVVAPPDRIVDATPAARAIVGRWYPGTSTRLPPALAEWYAAVGHRRRPSSSTLRVEQGELGSLVARLVGCRRDAIVLHERVVGRGAALGRCWGLTDRQTAAVRMVVAGATNPQIAAHLGISQRTVEKHLQQAFERLGVTNRTAAAAAVRRLEAGSPDPGSPWDGDRTC